MLQPVGLALLSTPQHWSLADHWDHDTIPVAQQLVAASRARARTPFSVHHAHPRLNQAGFEVDDFRMPPAEEVRYGLLRDEAIYVARRPE